MPKIWNPNNTQAQKDTSIRIKIFSIIVVCVLLCALSIYALTLGNYEIPNERVFELLFSTDSNQKDIAKESYVIHSIRLPRILGAIVIGAALALSGALYQGVIGNPLVSPGILGVLNGASFGAALGMVLGFNMAGIELLCFVFGFLAMCVAMLLSFVFDGYKSVLMLILGGVISSAFFGAGVSVLKLLADPYNTLPDIVYWLMGSLAHIHIKQTALIILSIVFALSFMCALVFSRHIDIINLDDESASALGVNVRRVRLLFIVIATLLASCSVALGGLIGWIGLVVPHIARFLIGASHRFMLIFCVLFGGLFLLFCDTLARSVSSTEIPIGILSALFGIPIFALVLFITKKRLA